MTRYLTSVWLLGGLLLFFALGNHQLQNSTEPRVAGIAMEMHLSNDWITPTLNGQPFLEKPPLSVWLDATAIHLLGARPLAVRLASAFAGLFTVLLLFTMLRRFGRSDRLAAGAVFVLVTTATFWSNARQVGEDALLCLGVTAALLAFFQASQRARDLPLPLGSWLLFSLGIVCSTLSKGVLGLALPGVVIFAYLLAETLIERKLVFSRWLRPLLFTVLALVPLLVWLWFLYGEGGSEALKAVLWTNSIGRFGGSFEEAGHYEPFYYYLSKLPEAFLPWNLLVYLGLWHFRKAILSNRYLLFFSLWLLAQFLLLSLASSKRMVYLMSLTPAAAVIAMEYMAVLAQRWSERAPVSPVAARLVRHGPRLVPLAMLALVCGYLSSALWLAPRADKEVSLQPLTDRVHALQVEGRRVVLFQPSERLAGASVFYSQSLLSTVLTDSELDQVLSDSSRTVAIMEKQTEPQAPLNIVDRIKVGDRVYYFVSH
jgi:4-amino-4-deoxy-L-arabinose transferase-like glycosyltransferase